MLREIKGYFSSAVVLLSFFYAPWYFYCCWDAVMLDGLRCSQFAQLAMAQIVYMGEIDTERQKLNCFRPWARGSSCPGTASKAMTWGVSHYFDMRSSEGAWSRNGLCVCSFYVNYLIKCEWEVTVEAFRARCLWWKKCDIKSDSHGFLAKSLTYGTVRTFWDSIRVPRDAVARTEDTQAWRTECTHWCRCFCSDIIDYYLSINHFHQWPIIVNH